MPPTLSVRIVSALSLIGFATFTTVARPLAAQVAPTIETLVPLDSARRLTIITPTLVSQLGLVAPAWPVAGSFREARLYRVDGGAHVLVVQRVDSTVSRFALDAAAVATLQNAVSAGLLAQGRGGDRLIGAGTGVVVSQPAGNTFVRNQTFLGLVAYGPATAALLSEQGGPAAAGGYFLAAGTSFFVAANLVKGRVVTRAQAARAAHGGTRGALTGLGIAAIANAEGGPAWGAPILAGAIGGTIVGFQQARGLSDGEAASAGFFADLGALTVMGIGFGSGAFKGRETVIPVDDPQFGSYTSTDNSLRGPGKAVVGAAIGANLIGYALGPRYAQRAAYNVTAGDVSVAFASALLGGVGASSLISEGGNDTRKYGVAAAGVLAGAFLADRGLVRKADRTSADGTLAQLGALAGALMGAGIAAIAETKAQGALALGSAGGILGLLAADAIIKPVRDAGPLRGIMQSSARKLDGRVFVSLGPVTSVRVTF
ncbi:hypothetical protein [Gemmatimonas sp.]|uniref:hypothetical protein n=1 Tax=Gemmatimonas sp. TaxID=1962908 RepID=UPI00356AF0DB